MLQTKQPVSKCASNPSGPERLPCNCLCYGVVQVLTDSNYYCFCGLMTRPNNMIAQSQSGTGKTAAFVLTMLSRVNVSHTYPQVCKIPLHLCLVLFKPARAARNSCSVHFFYSLGQVNLGLSVK